MRLRFVCSALFLVLAETTAAQTPPAQDKLLQGRAAEAVIWAMPAVNTDMMLQAALKAGTKANEIVYWSRPVDWRNQTLTPNPDAIYLMPFFDTKDGPVVIEVPPAGPDGSFTANIDDIWQMALEDAGPSGADKGAGGKYLLLPPGYTGRHPKGYIALPMRTYSGYALFRSSLRSHADADVAKAVSYAKRLKIYPLKEAANPPATKFTDAADVLFDATIPYDMRFFESLNRIVQNEPWLERDKAMIDPLRSLGIEKGKPFAPDAAAAAALKDGIGQAHAWLDYRLETAFEPYFGGAHWAVPASPDMIKAGSNGYSDPGVYPTDARAITYSIGYIGIKRLGAGQFYLMSGKDKEGQPLDGGATYRLTVPPDAPVQQYWSVTAYSRDTHALIRDVPRASRSSQVADLQVNPDRSVDIYFGPAAPKGKESNWVPTRTGERFELLFRLYAPTKPLFEKTWRLPDLVKADAIAGTKQSPNTEAQSSVPVTVNNFVRAETDLYFKNSVTGGGFGGWHHIRELLPIDHQTVIRGNRDTLYSTRVFDLDAGPVTVTLPDAGQRFMSLQIISEDQYTTTDYDAGPHTLEKAKIGTRYALAGVRTLVDPNDPEDLKRVHALQDAIQVSQPGGPGKFETPNWDKASQKKVREALLVLATTVTDTRRAFGTKEEIDPVQYLIGAASAWGANPPRDAIYLNVVPPNNDGDTNYELKVGQVPVDGFWSISIYDAQGYYRKNPLDAYTLNDITAKKNQDSSVTIRLGGCDGKIPNCLPITKGWNYMVRLYRPRPEILDGTWKFPEAAPTN